MSEADKELHEGGLADVARLDVLDHLQDPSKAPRALYLVFGGWTSAQSTYAIRKHSDLRMQTRVRTVSREQRHPRGMVTQDSGWGRTARHPPVSGGQARYGDQTYPGMCEP